MTAPKPDRGALAADALADLGGVRTLFKIGIWFQ